MNDKTAILDSLATQTTNHMNGILEDFCHEFYEHLDGYSQVTIQELTDAVIKGLDDFHRSINRDKIEKGIFEANDDLDTTPSDDED